MEGGNRRSLGVRFSRWTEDGWSAPAWIAKPGVGSQLALSAEVLPDGTWLAVWSSFDGEDDEVVYSRLTSQGWSRPRRISVDNAVPDVTPSLAPTRGGAIVAWSRYDGNDYRLRVARFEQGRWIGERWMGRAGSVEPTFLHDSSDLELGPRMLYQTASTDSWSLVTFGVSGRFLAESVVRNKHQARPIVHTVPDGAASLEWLPSPGTQ